LTDYFKLGDRILRVAATQGTGARQLTTSFAVTELIFHLNYLDIAVADLEAAAAEFSAPRARTPGLEPFEFDWAAWAEGTAAAVRFHYRAECVYTAARRLLDRLVVVVHQTLPRTQTDLGQSHSGFGPRLARRCAEVGLAVPGALLEQAENMNDRITEPRDLIEHPRSPRVLRGITSDSAGRITVQFQTAVIIKEGVL
jgi:hypothetical protein